MLANGNPTCLRYNLRCRRHRLNRKCTRMRSATTTTTTTTEFDPGKFFGGKRRWWRRRRRWRIHLRKRSPGRGAARSIVNRALCYPSGGHRKDLSPGWSETEAPANTRAGRRSNWQGILYSLWGTLANSPPPLRSRTPPSPLANPVTLALCSASLICYIVTYSRQRGLVGGGWWGCGSPGLGR